MIKLIKIDSSFKEQLIDMIDEWKEDINKNNTNHSPYAIFKNDPEDFEFYLNNLEIKNPKEGYVPDSTFFLYDDVRNRLLGACNIRHYLNKGLLLTGGHIGDGIRPSERRKGYGTKIISLALDECKKLNIDKVLITCDEDNIGSKKAIINNGGILENKAIDNNKVVLRFWIDNTK